MLPICALLLGLADGLAPRPAAAQPKLAVDERLNELCRTLNNWHECATAIERHQLTGRAAGVRRSGPRLSIPIARGRRVVLVDREVPAPGGIRYRYIQYLPNIGFHVVHVSYYEGDEYLMVSNVEGGRYFIPDRPHVSPDHSMVAAVSDADAYNIAGVFVFLVRNGTLSPTFWYEPVAYERFSFLRWIDVHGFAMTRLSTAAEQRCPGAHHMTVAVELSKASGHWVFTVDDRPSRRLRVGVVRS